MLGDVVLLPHLLAMPRFRHTRVEHIARVTKMPLASWTQIMTRRLERRTFMRSLTVRMALAQDILRDLQNIGLEAVVRVDPLRRAGARTSI